MDGQPVDSLEAEHPAGGLKSPPECVARKRPHLRAPLLRADERVGWGRAVVHTFHLPGDEVGQRAGVPPERNPTPTYALAYLAANPDVRAARGEIHVGEPQLGDLRDPQAAAAGEAEQDQVEPAVPRALGLLLQVN